MKTATYSLMHFTVAIAVAYLLTGSWSMALAIGLVEPFVQTFAFAIHERMWNRASGWSAVADGPSSARLTMDISKTPHLH
jgi:uncharacterized membrane protein